MRFDFDLAGLNISQFLKWSAEKYPWRAAVVFGKKVFRYRRLQREVEKMSECLRGELGVSPQDRVAVLLGNSDSYVISFFSVIAAGAVVVPLNTFLNVEELIYILNDCRAKLLITSACLLKERNGGEDASVTATLRSMRQRVRGLERVVLVDRKLEGFPFLEELLKKKLPGRLAPQIDPKSTAVIIYTSGTTGRPKGVELTHVNILSNVRSSLKAIEIRARDRFLIILPMFHAFVMTVCMMTPLAKGGAMVILGSVRPFSRVIRAIIFRRVSIIVGIPSLYRILSSAKIPRIFLFLFKVRLYISGAAPLEVNVIRQFEKKMRIPLLEGYGLTEASPVVSINPPDGRRRPGSVGIPLPDVEVKVVDEEERELSVDEPGELIVRGPNVMKGYFGQPEETSRTIKNGWLLTGDIARIDRDGFIYIVDRKKDMIISHGMNIYPREIEDVIVQLPEVRHVAVIGKRERSLVEIPVAVISREEGAAITGKEIIDYCKKKLAAYKVPHQVVFRDELPLTPTGKVLKRELKRELGY